MVKESDMDQETVPQFTNRFLSEHRIRKADLARLMGVTRMAVTKWESGSSIPSLETLLLARTKGGVAKEYAEGVLDRTPQWLAIIPR